ncbi:flippase [Sharpea azabuensis]|nr:flippase [Sharpea azabuensis]
MKVIKQTKSVKINAILNVIKEFMSIIFPMITFPYASRVLGLINYGKYTFSVSIVNYISYIAAAGILRYAIRECARVRDDRNKFNTLINEIFTINVITTIIAYIILAFLILLWKRLAPYTFIILTISLSVLFTTLGTDWINAANEDYLFITIRYICCQSIAIMALFVLVRSQDDVVWYALVSVLGILLANIANFVHIRRSLNIYPKLIFNVSIKRHLKPVLYLFASAIATFIYINSDITMLGIFQTDSIVGLYGVSTKFYTMIKQLINAAFVVVIPKISRSIVHDKEKASDKLSDILNITLLITIPAACGLFMVRKSLILLFSGSEYIQAESSLAILSISLIPALLANFFINIVLIPLGEEKNVMIATVTSAVINILLNFILIPIFAENGAAFTTLVAELTMMSMGIYFCKNVYFKEIKKSLLISLLSSFLIFVTCFIVNHLIDNFLTSLFLCVIFSIVVYGSLIFVSYKDDMQRLFKKG